MTFLRKTETVLICKGKNQLQKKGQKSRQEINSAHPSIPVTEVTGMLRL